MADYIIIHKGPIDHPVSVECLGDVTKFLREDGVFAIPPAVGGSANIKQTEVDFGTTPVPDGTFTVVDIDVLATSQLIAQLAYEAPTGKDLDELEFDKLDLQCAPGIAQFTLYARSADGGYVADKFKINYLVG